MLVAAYCLDAEGKLEARLDSRPAHLEFLGSLGERIKLAGPLMDRAGETPVGSIIILEADSPAHAEELLAGDPYRAVALFKSVDIRPWRGVLGQWLV